jgi:hypothetical protein
MASFVITLANTCSGQGHVGVDLALDGGAKVHFHYPISDLILAPPVDADSVGDILARILRYKFRGLTLAQARTQLTAGFTVTI